MEGCCCNSPACAFGPGPAARCRCPDHPGPLRLPAQPRAEPTATPTPATKPRGGRSTATSGAATPACAGTSSTAAPTPPACRPAASTATPPTPTSTTCSNRSPTRSPGTTPTSVRLRRGQPGLPPSSARSVEANVASGSTAGRIAPAELDLMRVRLIQNRTLLASCGPSSAPPSTATACSPARRPEQLAPPGDPDADGDRRHRRPGRGASTNATRACAPPPAPAARRAERSAWPAAASSRRWTSATASASTNHHHPGAGLRHRPQEPPDADEPRHPAGR